MAFDDLQRLRAAVRDVPDFPKAGILFKDITPLLADPELFRIAIDRLAELARRYGAEKVVGIDARGFLFGAPVAYQLGVGFVPVRKKGKLPFQCQSATYELEYGEATMEMHVDALRAGERVILVDDLLATGGTAAAAARLIRQMDAQLTAMLFLIELEFLDGRRHLSGVPVETMVPF
ncbi:MAG: adenine phosphoribosyltransferase [Verrucomicrobiota bacterium]|nr:adenine phosphoribosyltransferase [Verrucomicrobiota bacterium]